jgi:nucleolar protein 6
MRPTSRGIAFLEFPNATLLQQALKLHHTDLDGRIINVELTVGGGGSGTARKEKLDARKGRMTEQRERKAEKEAEEGGDAQAPSQGEGEIKMRGGRRVKPKTDGQVSDSSRSDAQY